MRLTPTAPIHRSIPAAGVSIADHARRTHPNPPTGQRASSTSVALHMHAAHTGAPGRSRTRRIVHAVRAGNIPRTAMSSTATGHPSTEDHETVEAYNPSPNRYPSNGARLVGRQQTSTVSAATPGTVSH